MSREEGGAIIVPARFAARIWLWPVVAATLLHLPSLFGDLVYDDAFLVAKHPELSQPGFLRLAWTRDYGIEFVREARGFYRPGLMTVIWAVHGLVGAHPMPYHLLILALFALTTALLTHVALALSGGRGRFFAIAAGLFYAAHPARVETVAFVMSLPDLVVEAAALLCVALLLRGEPSRPGRGTIAVSAAGALAATVVAALFKESAFFLLGALALTAAAFAGRAARAGEAWRGTLVLALAIVAGLGFGLGLRWQAGVGSPVELGVAWSQFIGRRSLTLWVALGDVARGLFLPSAPVFWREWGGATSGLAAVGVALVPTLFALAWLAAVRAGRLGPAMLLGWIGANLANLLILLSTGYPFSQRYLAVAPVVLLLALAARWAWARVAGRWPDVRLRRIALAVLALYLTAHAGHTLAGAATCRTQRGFFQAVHRANPQVIAPLVALADALNAAGAPVEEVAVHVQRATELDPGHRLTSASHELLIQRHLRDGNFAEALACADRARVLYPEDADKRALRAVSLAYLGRLDEALAEMDAALAARPGASEYETVRQQIARDLEARRAAVTVEDATR